LVFLVNLYDLEKLTSAADTALLSDLRNLAQAELTYNVDAWQQQAGAQELLLDCHGCVSCEEEEKK
jgi:NAD-dependent SIR2 family protein deacetylase